jgi:hypothetical protein
VAIRCVALLALIVHPQSLQSGKDQDDADQERPSLSAHESWTVWNGPLVTNPQERYPKYVHCPGLNCVLHGCLRVILYMRATCLGDIEKASLLMAFREAGFAGLGWN